MIEQTVTVTPRQALGHAVRQARLDQGMTQSALAIAAGVRRSRIVELERASGAFPMAREARQRVLDVLGLDAYVCEVASVAKTAERRSDRGAQG